MELMGGGFEQAFKNITGIQRTVIERCIGQQTVALVLALGHIWGDQKLRCIF